MEKIFSDGRPAAPLHPREEEALFSFSERLLRLASEGRPLFDFFERLSVCVEKLLRPDSVVLHLYEEPTPLRLSAGPRSESARPLSKETAARLRAERFFVFPDLRRSSPGARLRTAIGGLPRRGALLLIPIVFESRLAGMLELRSRAAGRFSPDSATLYSGVSARVSAAYFNQRAQSAVRERVKELTCLYGIARIAQRLDRPVSEILSSIAALLPPAWQYPEITRAEIVLDGRKHGEGSTCIPRRRLESEIVIAGRHRGVVRVGYAKPRPPLDEGPFLAEERKLIDAVARQVELIVERKEATEANVHLQTHLRHADRLATIGRLAAGVAHELNEPLLNILGFAQLMQKETRLSRPGARDLERIVQASLHARDVIRNLMIFARPSTPQTVEVDLNTEVEKALSFIEHQCRKANVRLIRALSPGLPSLSAAPAQVHQVIINLVVNALQAMPRGGRLKIATSASRSSVSLVVEDSGKGMTDEVRRQIFTPFFSTKDVDEGTGLGLSVVHGIVTAHRGSIRVVSKPGQGARFTVRFPTSPGGRRR